MPRQSHVARSRKSAKNLLLAASVAAVGLIARQQTANAGVPPTDTWTGNGTTNNWGDTGNWTTGAGMDDPPVNGDNLNFTGSNQTTNINENTASNSNLLTLVNSISFSANVYTLNAFSNSTALTVGSGGILDQVGGTQTFNQDLFVGSNQTWDTTSFGGSMLYGNVSLGNNAMLTLQGTSGAHTIGGGIVLSGNATVMNNGVANVIVGSNSTPGLTGSSTSIITFDSSSSATFTLEGNPTFAGTASFINSGGNGINPLLQWTTPFAGTILESIGSGELQINSTTALGSNSIVIAESGEFVGKAGANVGTLTIATDDAFMNPVGTVTITQAFMQAGSTNHTGSLFGSGATNSVVSITGTFGSHDQTTFSGSFANGVIVNGGQWGYFDNANSTFTGGLTLENGGKFNLDGISGGAGSLTGAGTFLFGAHPGDGSTFNLSPWFTSTGSTYATSANQVYSGFGNIDSGFATFLFRNGSSLAPGFGGTNGTLKFNDVNGAVSMQGGTTLQIDLSGTPSQVNIAGGFIWNSLNGQNPSAGNTETLSLTNPAVGTFDLIAYGSLAGGAVAGTDVTSDFTIMGLNAFETGDVTLQANDLQLIVTATPEPAGLSLLGLGAIGLLGRRRKRRRPSPDAGGADDGNP